MVWRGGYPFAVPLQWMVVLQRAPQPHKLAVTKKAEPTWADTTLACPHPGAQLSPLASSRDQRRVGGRGGKSQTFAWALSPAQTKSWLQHLRRFLERQEVVQGFVLQHHSKAEERMPSDEPPKPQGSPPSPLPSSCSHVSLRPLQTQTSKELLGDEAGVGETGPSPCHTAPGMSARLAASAGTRFCDRD